MAHRAYRPSDNGNFALAHPISIDVDVISPIQEDCEALNRALRECHIAARCTWHPQVADYCSADLDGGALVVIRENETIGTDIERVKEKSVDNVVLILSEAFDERVAGEFMQLGAADVVTLGQTLRLKSTLARSVDRVSLNQRVALDRTAAVKTQQHIASLMENTADAIALVQEGIVAETNKAWQTLFKLDDDSDGTAIPVMDLVHADSQATIKGALVAVAKNKWTDAPLDVKTSEQYGESKEVQMVLQAATFDGEPAVRIAIKAEEKEDKRSTSLMRDAITKDQSTFLYHRQHFLKLMTHRLKQPIESGMRLLAWIRIDDFKRVRDDLGVIRSEEAIAEFAELLRKRIEKSDIAGRFEGTAFTVLIERGSEQDAIAWSDALVQTIRDHTFEAGERTIRLSCSIGLCPFGDLVKTPAGLIEKAEANYREARQSGDPGAVQIETASEEDTRIRRHDAVWVKRLTNALKENRFRLLQQPIAALDGEGQSLFDLLVRMVDEQGESVAPSEFLPVARRNNMMQALDRWVIGAALALCRERQPGMVFIRLSEQSLADKSFLPWLKAMVARGNVPPAMLCFQVPEAIALKYLKATARVAQMVRTMGASFAIEHLGRDAQASKLLQSFPLDFAKIDGALISALSSDSEAHAATSKLVSIAKERGINTIAEKVEDANTMAALWQLGISYMQGHYVQEPEVVLQESA
ncbi:MAG: EAL domain-containing protein [Pseudomonadota bacterium]